ncbi:MAG: carbohydrate ABC transporter permease [Tyzzerella sp.]|nr:carbohydrate ABC transporter permease [Tyzzerella sp.]
MRIRKKEPEDVGLLFKRTKQEKLIFAFFFLLFAIYACVLIFPFIWLFLSSLKGGIEYELDNALKQAFALPDVAQFKNYFDAYSKLQYDGTNLWGMTFNSIWYTAVVTLEGVFFSSVTGYCLSKYNFKLKNLIYTIAVFSMTIPIVGTLGASFKLAADLHIYDSPLQPILSCAGGFGFNFLIMYGFFKNISWNYAEAVFVDGGSHFTAFFRVMLPLAKTPMMTLGIMSAINCWNDYTSVILFLPSYPTIAAGLYYVERELTRGYMPIYFAALFVSMLPIIIIFACFSDKIMKNFTMGGLKG